MLVMANIWIQLVLLLLGIGLRSTQAQDYDFSAPIKCFVCEGDAYNSTCADPFTGNSDERAFKHCDQGMCLKWTKYKGGELQMVRACTADLNFHLTMIDGVCRTERNGNGDLCMCGKSLCNSASKTFVPKVGHTAFQTANLWLTFGLLFLFSHWILHSFWQWR